MTPSWFDNYDRNFGLKADDTGEDEARFIRRVLHLRRGQSVLDIPCGAGRVAAHLANYGCKVTGVDMTPSYIRRARARFRKDRLDGRFICSDMRSVDFQNRFHAIYIWQGSFGIFSDAENLGVVCGLARALRKGGRLLIDQPNREFILRHFRPTRKSGSVRSVTTWNPKTERMTTRFTETLGRNLRSWHLTMQFYTPRQFRRLFESAGLKVEAMYGDLAGTPYSRGSRRIHAVGRKP